MKNKTTKIILSPIKVLMPNGFCHGIVTKRPASTKEVRYIMKNIFGIGINTRDDMYSKEEYDDYNKELTQTFNDWLNGDADDQSIMNYAYDCADEQLGVFNAFRLAEYLQKKEVI